MITADNYYTTDGYMSSSMFKAIRQCGEQALAGRPVTEALLVGSYFDAMFDGQDEAFRKEHPESLKRGGELRAPFAHCHVMYERVMDDPLFSEYTRGELQPIFTGEINGVPVKCKIDVLHPERIVDIKTTQNFSSVWSNEHGTRVSWAEAWRYDIQGAIYQELVYQNTGEKLPFYLCAVTKEAVPDYGIFEIPQHALDDALAEVKLAIEQYYLIYQGILPPSRCEHCDHCKATKTLKGIKDWREE